jgi:hypothetical protein
MKLVIGQPARGQLDVEHLLALGVSPSEGRIWQASFAEFARESHGLEAQASHPRVRNSRVRAMCRRSRAAVGT